MNYLFLIKNIRRIAPATAAAKMATTAPAMVAVPVKSKYTSLLRRVDTSMEKLRQYTGFRY